MARLKYSDEGLPALVDYRRNLTPTAEQPQGTAGLWKNPEGRAEIGNFYEPWSFSADGKRLAIATDAFRSTITGLPQPLGQGTAAFMDVAEWKWAAQPAVLEDVTRYDATLYPYSPNGVPEQNKSGAKYFGHWEEPAVFFTLEGWEYLGFGSSANLSPAWNPLEHSKTFGLETWLIPEDRTSPARKVTSLNGGLGQRSLVYPTDNE